jgi:hypothetical protein
VASWAVRKITAVRSFSARIRRHTSNPSRSGIITSSSTASGRNDLTSARPWRPSLAVATSNPAWCRADDSRKRMFSSSSTTRTRGTLGETVIPPIVAHISGSFL